MMDLMMFNGRNGNGYQPKPPPPPPLPTPPLIRVLRDEVKFSSRPPTPIFNKLTKSEYLWVGIIIGVMVGIILERLF